MLQKRNRVLAVYYKGSIYTAAQDTQLNPTEYLLILIINITILTLGSRAKYRELLDTVFPAVLIYDIIHFECFGICVFIAHRHLIITDIRYD